MQARYCKPQNASVSRLGVKSVKN